MDIFWVFVLFLAIPIVGGALVAWLLEWRARAGYKRKMRKRRD